MKMGSRNQLSRKMVCLVILGLLLLPVIQGWDEVGAEPPPPLGEGDWIVTTNTVIKDQTIRLKGNLVINSGATLVLENTTLLMYMTTKYEHKISIKSGGGLHLTEDSLLEAFDERFAAYAEPGSSLKIQNSTLTNFTTFVIGSWDAIIEDSYIQKMRHAIVTWGGHVEVHRSWFFDNNDGMWNVYGDMKIHNNTFLGNHVAVIGKHLCAQIDKRSELGWWAPEWTGPVGDRCAGPRTLLIEDNLFTDTTSTGVFLARSDGLVRNNIIRKSNGFGVQMFDGGSTIQDNDFIDNRYGITIHESFLLPGPFTMNLINNNFYNCWLFGVHAQYFTEIRSTWVVTKEVYSDSKIQLRGPIDIKDGGHFHMEDNELLFLPTGFEPQGIVVEPGGALTLDGVEMRSEWDVDDSLYLEAHEDTTVSITDSSLYDVGYSFGSDGAKGGVYSKGDLTVENTLLDGGLYGVISGDGNALVKDVTIRDGSYGLATVDGHLEAYNTTMTNISLYDVELLGGQMDLFNTSIDKSRYKVNGGTLNAYWDCDLMTQWQNGHPVGNVTYNITEADGALISTGVTDENGLSARYWLREFTETSLSRRETTPHKVTGTVIGLTNSSLNLVLENTRLTLYIQDDVDPTLNVTSPGLLVHQTNNTLVVNGTASDEESGIDKVQWSFDMDLWNDANGAEDWGFSVVLEYGSRLIYVRALDQAGNVDLKMMTVTIDKDAPYLVVMSPKDGFITPLRTILVEGYAEIGSTVTVKGLSLTSTTGEFRLSVPIDEGENILNVTATDPTGNTNTTSLRVYRDTTPPEITITSPPEDYVTNDIKDQLLTIAGFTEIGALFYVNGKAVSLSPNGTFSFTVGLEEGLNVINFIAKDNVGNQNTTVRRVVYDLINPTLTVYSPMTGTFTNETTVKAVGITEPGINITANSGNFTNSVHANREGRFEIEIGLSEGPNLLKVIATDEAGNQDIEEILVTRDTIAPQIMLLNAFDGLVIDTSSFMIEGETEPGAKVKINGELVSVGFTGRFSKWIYLPSANNTFIIEAVDQAGNRNSDTTLLKRKAVEEPKPPGVSIRADYFPWALFAAIAILVVQWVLLFHFTRKKKLDDEATADDLRPMPSGRRRPPKGERFYPKTPTRQVTAGPRRQPRRKAVEDDLEDADGDEFDFGDDPDEDEFVLEVPHEGGGS